MNAVVITVVTVEVVAALACFAALAVWWVREGRAERRIDAKQAAVRAEVARLPRPSILLPHDQALDRLARERVSVGCRVWSTGAIDTTALTRGGRP